MRISSLLLKSNLPHTQELQLLEHITGKSKSYLLAHSEINLLNSQLREFNKLLSRLKNGEPLPYVIGTKYFYESKFIVNNKNLIPRNETELLVDLTIQEIKKIAKDTIKILEIGTGTGCIAISIAKFCNENLKDQKIEINAIDSNTESTNLARVNANNILTGKAKKYIKFLTITPLKLSKNTKYDIIVSNPPYIPTKDYLNLNSSVFNFEPREALDGGEDGLKIYREIFQYIAKQNNPHPILLLEIYEKKEFITNLRHTIQNTFPKSQISILNDLAGRQRFCKIVYC